MNEEQLRVEFEKWYEKRINNPFEFNELKCRAWNDKTKYHSITLQKQWEAWKAAAEFAYNEGVGDGKGY